jgi:hypothetical protein
MAWALRRLAFDIDLLSFSFCSLHPVHALDLEWYEKSEKNHAPQVDLLETTSAQETSNPSEPFCPRDRLVPVVFPGPVSQEGCCQFTCELLKHIMYQRQQLPLPYEQLKHFYRKPSPQVSTGFKGKWVGRLRWRQVQRCLRNLQGLCQPLQLQKLSPSFSL